MSASIHDTDLRRLLEDRARSRPGNVFAVFEHARLRYGEFNDMVDRVAASLHMLGVGQGDRVVCALPNGLETMCIYFAVAKLGAVNVFVNAQYEADLFAAVSGSVQPKAYIVDEENIAKLRRFDSPGTRIVVGGGTALRDEEVAYPILLQGDPARLPSVRIDPGDPVQYIFTSGTTGLPKACILSHRARLSLSDHVVRLFGASEEDRFFGCLPNYHGNIYFAILGALISGGSVAIAKSFQASRYWDLVRQFGATLLVLHAVPMNILLTAAPRRDDADNTARGVLTVGGKFQEFVTRFGIDSVLLCYGATEVGLTTLGILSGEAARNAPASYAGRVRDDHQVRIVRPDGTEAGQGEMGEIQVRARVPYTVFSGYHAASSSSHRPDGSSWYRTNDRGAFDEDGVLHFYGRLGESIRVKGEFVPVQYLESLVREHPAVADCAAIGIASEIGDQDLVVFVQLRDGTSMAGDELIEFLKPRVPKFMVPKSVEFVAQFPRAPATLKIQKNKLLDA
ncbi:MAG: AMP-binding protein, partial [Candidimonas sp.]